MGRELTGPERGKVHDVVHGQNMDYQKMVDELLKTFHRPGDGFPG